MTRHVVMSVLEDIFVHAVKIDSKREEEEPRSQTKATRDLTFNLLKGLHELGYSATQICHNMRIITSSSPHTFPKIPFASRSPSPSTLIPLLFPA